MLVGEEAAAQTRQWPASAGRVGRQAVGRREEGHGSILFIRENNIIHISHSHPNNVSFSLEFLHHTYR